MHRLTRLLIWCMTVAMVGCAAMRTPDIDQGLPEEVPVPAHSLYASYLACLGEVLEAQGGPEVDVLVGGLEDNTRPPSSTEPGFLTFGGRLMARTSLARLAPRIGVITPEAFHPERTTLLVKGGFTELDRTTLSRAWGLGIRLAGLGVNLDMDHTFDVITLDIELAQPDGRQLPGLAAALSVLVDSKTQDGYLTIEKGDGSVAASAAGKLKSVSRRHASQRLLIDMGLYWLFSGYFAIDGRSCLDKPSTDVEATQALVRAYRKLSTAERVSAIQRLLTENGYHVGSIDGALGEPTRRAICQFQADHGDPPTGQISARLYLQLSRPRTPLEPTVVFSSLHYHTQRVPTSRGAPPP